MAKALESKFRGTSPRAPMCMGAFTIPIKMLQNRRLKEMVLHKVGSVTFKIVKQFHKIP